MRLSRQPLLGLVTTVLIIAISMAFISLFDADVFGTWVAFYVMCAIPFTFVVGAFWHGQHPVRIAWMRQPWRGIAYLALAAVVAAIVGTVLLMTVGAGLTPPTPMVTQCVIISVPFSFWFTVMWGGWPFTKMRSPLLGGVLVLVATYGLAALVFRLFNFSFLAGAPVYSAAGDPQGPFDAWSVLLLVVTSMAAAFLLAHFDLWPLNRRPGLMKQPVLGVLWTVIAVAIATIAMYLGLHFADMPPPQFLTTVPVPFLFGSIVVINVFQGSLFTTIAQPLRGLVSALVAAIVGLALARLYMSLSGLVSGDQVFGAPGFAGEIWLANALLAVTFPFLAFFGDFFQSWPFRRDPEQVDEDADVPAGVRELREAIE